jgi:hypothetical protein
VVLETNEGEVHLTESNKPQSNSSSQDGGQIRPDPMFKDVTRQLAREMGLELRNIELPQMLKADLIFSVPLNVDLSNTLFDFFYLHNIIEFKSQDDDREVTEFLKNEARTTLFAIENPNIPYKHILNLVVCSRYPQEYFKSMKDEGLEFISHENTPWLYYCKVGWQNRIVVVCRSLPLEKRFFNWLLFSPADSTKWEEFVKMLARRGELELLAKVRDLRPREFKLLEAEIMNLLYSELSPDERVRYREEKLDLIQFELELLWKEDPDMVGKALSKLSPETLVAKLTPEQRKKVLEFLLRQEQLSESNEQKPN